jgi:hypothetical protein
MMRRILPFLFKMLEGIAIQAMLVALVFVFVLSQYAIAQQGTPFIPADSVSKRVAVTAEATGTTAAVPATIPADVGYTAYLCGFSVSPGSATTAITINVVVTGLINGTMTWAVGAPVTAAGVTGAVLTVPFTPCMPASAINSAITVTSGALGTSGINNDVNAWGYYVESR